ncbi:Endonuclease/exonuclease/phosphatase, partial [Mycena vitilis]
MPPTAGTTSTAKNSFASSSVIVPTRKPQQTPAPAKKTVENPLSAHHPSRLVVQILPEGVKPDDRPDPLDLVKGINAKLAANEEAKHLVVVSTKWNAHGNCIVLTRSDQTAAELAKHARLFVDLISKGQPTVVREDSKWLKIQVNGVRTGALDPMPGIYSPETIHAELCAKNPLYARLKFVMLPRFIRASEELASMAYSSIVFAVEDEEQAHHLLREVNPPPRVTVYYRKRPDFTITLRSDIAQDLDIQVVDVAQPGAPTATYVNVYNDSKQRRPAVERIKAIELPNDTPVIPLGDWNLHHEGWSCTGIKGNTRSNGFVEWTTNKGFSLLNKKGEVTYVPHGSHGSPSVIDLTHVNAAAIQHDTVKDWTIDGSMSYGSDHKGIRWVMDHGRREVENPAGDKYSLKDVEPQDWSKAFRETLERHRPEIAPIMDDDAPVTNEQLESAAKGLTDAMREATEKVGKI